MKYVCRLCKDHERGSDTREEFVQHMLFFHGVTITVTDLLDLEGLTPWAEKQRQRSERRRDAETAV